ncbi:MAG TPA: type II secretion system protein [Acidimicrobiia bacterium]|nr:type II secretion system protein [Acidimicrobiia bacterium]
MSRLRAEGGMSLVEVMVTVALLSFVSAAFLPLMATANRSVHPMQVKSQSIDSLRNALATIGRELRSASCVAEPAANGPAGTRLRFTTEANDTTYEVTYTTTGGELQRQVTGESSVLLLDTGLVSTSDSFTHIATPRRTVKVLFHFQPDPGEPATDLSTVIAGRNAWQGC